VGGSRAVRLVPDLEEAVPRPGSDGHSVLGHAETADAVVMPSENTYHTHTQTRTNITYKLSKQFF